MNEARTYKSLLKCIAKSDPDCRFLAILDSRVTIGAAAKGRSSSESISCILRGSLAYCVGGNIYPGLLHGPSKKNPADAPSRDRDVPLPTREVPVWLTDLQAGCHWRFDCTVRASQFSLNAARWLRFLLLLGGDIERNPGPAKSRQPRGPLDLKIGFAQVTADRMAKCSEVLFKNGVSHQALTGADCLGIHRPLVGPFVLTVFTALRAGCQDTCTSTRLLVLKNIIPGAGLFFLRLGKLIRSGRFMNLVNVGVCSLSSWSRLPVVLVAFGAG